MSGHTKNWRNRLINTVLLTGGIGCSVLAYASFVDHNREQKSKLLHDFSSATHYDTVHELIDDLETRNISEQMCKLRAYLRTSHENPIQVVTRSPITTSTMAIVNDDEGGGDDDEIMDDDHRLDVAIYHVHGERVVFQKISPANTSSSDTTAELAVESTTATTAVQQASTVEASASVTSVVETTLTKRLSQEEQYEYIVHGDLVLCDRRRRRSSSDDDVNNNKMIHINDPINVLYNTRLDLKVLSDDTLTSDPLLTQQAIMERHLTNRDTSHIYCHALTEIHTDSSLSPTSIDDVEEEGGEEGDIISSNNEQFLVEKQVFFNVLRQVLPNDTRVFVYGKVQWNSERNRYELTQILECSNIVNEWTMTRELWSDHLLSNGTFVALSGIGVSCFVLAAKRMLL